MYVKLSNHSFCIADAAINKIAENPYRFPRPNEMPGTIEVSPGRRLPGVPFVYMMTFLFERCMEFLLQRFLVNLIQSSEALRSEGKEAVSGNAPFRRTVYMYPWAFSCVIMPTNATLTVADLEELLKRKEEWSKFFNLEITGVELKIRDQSRGRQQNPESRE